jgi:endoglucanase
MRQMSLRSTRARLAAVCAVLITAMTAGLIGAASASASPQGCRVDYKVTSEWQGGFIADVKVTNLGAPIDGWQLEWAFPSGQQVGHAWLAKITSSGDQVTAENYGYNSRIGTDKKTSFGFSGSWSGANEAPATFKLNGVTCDGTVSDPEDLTAIETVEAMEPGWNVGNTLDAIPDETSWGNPLISGELLDTVKAAGYKSIRLPVSWSDYIGEGPDYTIDQARMDRVAEVVDMAIERDLYVLLNVHHDSWQWIRYMPTDHDDVVAKFEAVWTQIAERFKDHSELLVLESNNEPQFEGTTYEEGDAYNDELNRLFHEIVRGTGGENAERLLVLPTLHTNADQARLDALDTTIAALDDDMIAATVHFYGWWPFSVNNAGGTTYDENVEADIVGTFDRVGATFVDNGIPVIVGEWGVLNYDHNRPGVHQYGELLKFYEAVEWHARDTGGIAMQIWDAGQFLNRETLQWRDQHIFDYFASGWTTRSGTTSFDSVYLDKSEPIAAESLTLNRNGLDFEGLWLGEAELVEGADYTVEGDTLTFTAAGLTALAGDRSYGTNSTVEARFSDGMPWQIHIITYDRPVLSDATGTVDSFAIPTAFTGDQLSTMESVYTDDGTPTGGDWTPFKEYWSTFQPDYGAGTIILKTDYLNGIEDGRSATLTFHFWGGGEISYEVTRSGSTLTGTAL